ncbi:MAG TPA: sigma-70 family RNA polymerase sigma factor [Solirubrobacteraceae bacterium]|nr:sigma-70 family RNA polymerase sigma factor [Solirubrobacteraceae bacterium]
MVDVLFKLAGFAGGFDEIEAGFGAEAATDPDDDDDEEDPQPARASAAVAASATAPYRIDDEESAMLTGLLLRERGRRGCPPDARVLCRWWGREGMATGSPPARRRSRGHGSRLPPHRCRLAPPEVSLSQFSLCGHLSVMGELRANSGDLYLLRSACEDPEAFGAFYRRHAVGVERWIRRQTPDAVTAADLTAETFAQALVGLKRFRGSSDDAACGWLYGIARNLVRRYHRRGRVELATCRKLGIQLDHDLDELAEIESKMDAAEQAATLTRALDTLPDSQRQALQLRVVDEMDYDQAAALMGTSEQNARIRVSRALKALSLRLQGGSR